MSEETPHQIPVTSIWPLLLGAGITMLIIGIITHWLVSVVGIILLIFSLGGWTQENREQSLKAEQHAGETKYD